MKYAVIGPGSVGSLITYSLNRSGIDPLIIFRTTQKARLAGKRGLSLQLSNQATISLRGYFTSYSEIPEGYIDVAFICTKSYDVPMATSSLKPKLKEKATVISVQNGLGSYEVIEAMLPEAEVLALVLNCGIFRKSDYDFIFSGCSKSYIGWQRKELPENIDLVAEHLKPINVKLVKNITPYRWIKLAVNAAVNPLTAIRGVKNGDILTDKYLRTLASSVVNEVKAVADSLKIRVFKDPMKELAKVVDATKNNYSSMLQDILAGRRTEIDFINGAVVGRASMAGIDVPLNKALWLLVKSIESTSVNP